MLGKLEEIYKKYLELEKQITDPDAMNDMKRYIQLSKDHKELQPIVAAYKNYRNVMSSLDAAKEILEKEKDEEMRAYVKEELFELSNQRDQMEESIRLMLIPADPQDRKNAVVEIRAGTGATKPVSLPATFTACISNSSKPKAGKLSRSALQKARWADIKKSSSMLWAKVFMDR